MKNRVLTMLLCVSFLLSMCVIPTGAANNKNADGDEVIVSSTVLDSNVRGINNTKNSLQYTYDAEGNIFGAQDFWLEGGRCIYT